MVKGMNAREEGKEAELRIVKLESSLVLSPEPSSRAGSLGALADAYKAVGDACLQQALRSFPDQVDDIKRAAVLSRLGFALLRRGDYSEALLLHEKALAMLRRLLPESHADIATSLNNLAICHHHQGEYGKAVLLYEEALAMQRQLLPEDHPDIASSLNNLAACHFSKGEYSQAVLLSEEAVAMRRRLLPEDHRDMAASLGNLAGCRCSQGEYGKAVLLYEEALAMQRRLLPEDHPDIATSLSSLARCHFSQGEYGKAALLHEKALAMRRRLLPEDHPVLLAISRRWWILKSFRVVHSHRMIILLGCALGLGLLQQATIDAWLSELGCVLLKSIMLFTLIVVLTIGYFDLAILRAYAHIRLKLRIVLSVVWRARGRLSSQ
jgi:tetratricopeptide (TPR) repeat protein